MALGLDPPSKSLEMAHGRLSVHLVDELPRRLLLVHANALLVQDLQTKTSNWTLSSLLKHTKAMKCS